MRGEHPAREPGGAGQRPPLPGIARVAGIPLRIDGGRNRHRPYGVAAGSRRISVVRPRWHAAPACRPRPVTFAALRADPPGNHRRAAFLRPRRGRAAVRSPGHHAALVELSGEPRGGRQYRRPAAGVSSRLRAVLRLLRRRHAASGRRRRRRMAGIPLQRRPDFAVSHRRGQPARGARRRRRPARPRHDAAALVARLHAVVTALR